VPIVNGLLQMPVAHCTGEAAEEQDGESGFSVLHTVYILFIIGRVRFLGSTSTGTVPNTNEKELRSHLFS
jgi:hypothetical protein